VIGVPGATPPTVNRSTAVTITPGPSVLALVVRALSVPVRRSTIPRDDPEAEP
jgi:hypothetical protein